MIAKLMRVYGIGMAIIAFNPMLVLAGGSDGSAARKILSELESLYDITDIVLDETENTYSFVIDGNTVRIDLDTGCFAIRDADGDLHSGDIQLADGFGTSKIGAITLNDENQEKTSYSAVVDVDSQDENIINITAVGEKEQAEAAYNIEQQRLSITVESRQVQAHALKTGTLQASSAGIASTELQRKHQGQELAAGSRQIFFAWFLVILVVVVAIAVGVAIANCACPGPPAPPAAPAVPSAHTCSQNPCAPGCQEWYGSCN